MKIRTVFVRRMDLRTTTIIGGVLDGTALAEVVWLNLVLHDTENGILFAGWKQNVRLWTIFFTLI